MPRPFPAEGRLAVPLALASAVAVLLAPRPVLAAPEDRGPHTVLEWDAGRIAADRTTIRTQVLYPADGAPGPIVGVMHGNLREGRFHLELARTLASRGAVVVLPDMPCGAGGCDHEANARQLLDLLDWAATQGATAGSRLEGRVDPDRRALVGHSWGGLGTFLATAADGSIDAWVGLDPEEDRGAALAVAGRVSVPSAHLMAEVPGLCNGDWGADVYAATAAPHLRMTIAGSGHCDPELPTDALCPLACGAGDDATTPVFRRYAVAFVLCALGMDATMAEWVGGASFAADEGAGRLSGVTRDGLEAMRCGGGESPDAGVGLDAGAVTDAGALTDAGSGSDAGAVTDAGSASATDAGSATVTDSGSGSATDSGPALASASGCGCRAGRASHGGLLAAALLALGVMLRARSRTRRV